MTETGKEYGTALFMLACEEQAKKEYAAGLDCMKTAFAAEPDYLAFLASPGIPLSERLSAIEAAFFGSVPEYLLSWLQLLCEKGRMGCFYDSVQAFRELLDASEHVSEVKVTSAVPLTEEEKQKLQKKLEQRSKGSVNINYFEDAALLGGLVIEMDGTIMDGSLRHRLREVKDVIST